MPPSLLALDTFLADTSASAYERAVDALLESSRYGERWAWDWLDAARYADTNGYQGDPVRTMWPWRDWVIEAANMPYDQFTVEQLAGDLLDGATRKEILVTAFNRNQMYNGEGGRIPEETCVEIVGTLWMGLTLTCSRCHDHKFDPITQREYYSLFDYFNQTTEEGGGFNGKVEPVLDMSPDQDRLAVFQSKVETAAALVERTEQSLFPRDEAETVGLLGEHVDALRLHAAKRSSYYLDLLSGAFSTTQPSYAAQLNALRTAVQNRDQQATANTLVMVMDEREKPRESFVLTRGAYDKNEEKVTRGVPMFLPLLPNDAPPNRLALAQWLVSGEHPLTARVTVNRFWQAFFPHGLVKTPEDFGSQGALPSHPGLLDYLAVAFTESGWDVKALRKMIVMSATYRQTSPVSEELLERDPENVLLARGPRHRRPAWMIRDQALFVSGLAGRTLGLSLPAQGHLVGGYLRTNPLPAGRGRRPLSAKPLHLLATHHRTASAFRQRQPADMHGEKQPHQHAHARADDLERSHVRGGGALHGRARDGLRACGRGAHRLRLPPGRLPRAEERSVLRSRLQALRRQYADDPEAALALLSVGEAPRDRGLEATEHAAFTGLFSLLLNLDETITKQ